MMTAKERIAYNQSLAEQIKTVLPLEESFVYEHNMIFKDYYGNLVKIEFVHYKNEEGYKAHQANEEYKEECRAEKIKKKGEVV
jgi:hypothetical protein